MSFLSQWLPPWNANRRKTEIGVVGAGVIGLTSALKILESVDNVNVTVIAEKFTPHTTADVAVGVMASYSINAGSQEKLSEWSAESNKVFRHLIQTEPSGQLGLMLCPVYSISETESPTTLASQAASSDYRELTEEDLSAFPSNYKYGHYDMSVTFACKKYLPYLMARFQKAGGHFIKRKLDSLDELAAEFDVVVNCPGVGAVSLVPDPKVIPTSGQTIRVQAPWVKSAVVAGDSIIVPTVDYVVLGGTLNYGDTSTVPDPETAEAIRDKCIALVPSLKDAQIETNLVGIRPYRDVVRLEIEYRNIPSSRIKLPVIHNYGHGGAGITVSWGCAKDVVKLLEQVIRQRRLPNKMQSKL